MIPPSSRADHRPQLNRHAVVSAQSLLVLMGTALLSGPKITGDFGAMRRRCGDQASLALRLASAESKRVALRDAPVAGLTSNFAEVSPHRDLGLIGSRSLQQRRGGQRFAGPGLSVAIIDAIHDRRRKHAQGKLGLVQLGPTADSGSRPISASRRLPPAFESAPIDDQVVAEGTRKECHA